MAHEATVRMSGRRCTVLALSLLCACGFVGVEPPEGSTFEDELSIVATGDFPFALATDDILATVDALSARGVPFMTAPPETYYEMLSARLPDHGEPEDALKKRGVLLDGTTEGESRVLLQIFTECALGPVFFEIIQRKGDEGFGEGNFKALFESIERDQLRRGVLEVPADDVKRAS